MKEDFKVQVIINNSLATVLADTGASISVCGKKEAKRWNLLPRMVETQARIKPYNSPPIPIAGTTKCAVTFGNSSIPVEWHIIDSPCEPVLAGHIAKELGILKFDAKPTVFHPIQMIQATKNDPTLTKIVTLISQGSTWIAKTESKEVQRFQNVLPELTITANGIILKGEKIVLPNSLQDAAIRLAHRGAHPGQSGLERRLRYHFFSHNMGKKIEDFVKACNHCSMFVDKKTKEPIKPHRVPEKCWDTVSVDLFGPMPTSKHVVVVQDLASRFPAAKLVTSTKADKVLPALSEIYATYGNPEVQISDNGPPFNSAQMHHFAANKSIKLQMAPPLHPSSNPVETFMRPLGKAMKIAHQTGSPEREALESALNSYRHTPHPATGIPPAAMMFRDGQRYDLPRTYATEEDVR